MLDKPDFPDEKIIACLDTAFGQRIEEIAFLPLGGDQSTAVYRAVTDDGAVYFCKLRRGDFDETSVALPRYLSDQGIAQIIPPLPTRAGQLQADLGEFHLILYPFVEGTNGFDVELSEGQWADFGEAMKRIHTTPVPPSLLPHLQMESYSPVWRERCRNILSRLDQHPSEDAIARDAIAFLRLHQDTILDFLARAESLAPVMADRCLEFVLCHSDIHPGNLLIDTAGTLFIVDWDYPVLAPKERDLMFIGGGQGFKDITAEEEEARFFQGYGPTEIDPVAMAYYRYERNITDIAVECERIFSTTLGEKDRAQSLEILGWGFLPGSTIERAQVSGVGF